MEELIMSWDLYTAALKGDVGILSKEQGTGEGAASTRNVGYNEFDKYFLTYTLEERNTILHVAARNGENLNFVVEALKRFPTLIDQKNSKGETAFHISARQGNKDIIEHLVTFYCDIEATAAKNNDTEPVWRVKNSEGDTPLHIAMKRGKIQVVLFLISLDNSLAGSVNNRGETPLHLAAEICTGVGASNNGLIKQSSSGGKLREDILRVIYLLLRKPSFAVLMRDKDGLTPLLKAACCRNCIPFISVLIAYNPQLSEQRDLIGRTILHLMNIEGYKEGKRFLATPEINPLKDEQDFDGDTPIHIAIKNSDFMKVRVLMECSADFTINNSCGISAWDLIHSQEDFAIRMKDETDKAMDGLMERQMYRAAMGGDVQFLSQHDDIYFLSRTKEGNNILHIALGSESMKATNIVIDALKRCPILLCQTNSHGDTPLHLAARLRSLAAQELTISCKDTFQNKLELVVGASFLYSAPWRVKNLEGNTPLHEALRAGNAICARILLLLDDEVASFVNNNKETPLHFYAKYQQIPGPLWRDGSLAEIQLPEGGELDLLLTANMSALFSRDMDGLNPLLRAAQRNNFETIRRILDCCPSSAEICDLSGRMFLHLMPLDDKTEVLLESSQIKAQIEARDHEGNTPLHIAIRNRQFKKVKVLLKHGSKDLLDMVNSQGEAPIDLIRLQIQVPHEILELFRDMSQMPQGIYGMPEVEVKENVHILLVIAVLLATITFAAGFTVPGGFNDSGVPILINEGAFKVFLISNAYAMCSSMLALFSLFWFMTGKASEALKLIDLSVFVLQQAFYGTIVAFMTGVYVTISPKALWTAILVCILCSGLILCSFKPLNMLLSRIFSFAHGILHTVAVSAENAGLPYISCLCYALLSGSHLESSTEAK
ncbi:hypothetical protein BVRB_3g050910 isoform B [Beta vulgaris subsp. vulgaris]|uniref:PGG domain-containing protein n=1 Tax=Beta vulgaris subsp. vulgaris TaxID=3555 RepID=A0A0J8CWZ2_BETVV|nr:hypothetical protein BVRB_3g050910 isoform B [Beta vulgaris subsp. vulgaris]